jgi:hypothetical protein
MADDIEGQMCGRYGVRPCGWTVSGCGFDCLPGVVILELHWAEIAECGMQPSSSDGPAYRVNSPPSICPDQGAHSTTRSSGLDRTS